MFILLYYFIIIFLLLNICNYLVEPPNTKLMEVEVPILDISVCKEAYRKETGVIFDNRVLCAGHLEGGKDSCQVYFFKFFVKNI